jgi:hypothetical protein
MSDWSHGYDVSVGYSFGFFREMAPDWLDFCSRLAGYEVPERADGKFRYLELGSGQGFGLCLLAPQILMANLSESISSPSISPIRRISPRPPG